MSTNARSSSTRRLPTSIPTALLVAAVLLLPHAEHAAEAPPQHDMVYVPAGEERAMTGKYYFIRGGPDELLERWKADFGK